MRERTAPTVYFAEPGPANTERTLALAYERMKELDIRRVLVATTSGATGARAAQLFPADRLVVVSHSAGFLEPNVQELLPEHRAAIERAGVPILTCTHAFGGVGRAVRRKLATYQVDEIMAYTLRIFGQGVKVGVEMALMAADAGLVRCDQEIITIAGTRSGADTALVIRPAHAQDLFDLQVLEIICKPRLGV
jgi:hypothetical protein